MPKLAALTVGDIVPATGLSSATAWRIRKETVPHPMWWEALTALVRGEPVTAMDS